MNAVYKQPTLPQLTLGAPGLGEHFTSIGSPKQVLDILSSASQISITNCEKQHPRTTTAYEPRHGFDIAGALVTNGTDKSVELEPFYVEISVNGVFDVIRLEPREMVGFGYPGGLNATYVKGGMPDGFQHMGFEPGTVTRFTDWCDDECYETESMACYRSGSNAIILAWKVRSVCDCELFDVERV